MDPQPGDFCVSFLPTPESKPRGCAHTPITQHFPNPGFPRGKLPSTGGAGAPPSGQTVTQARRVPRTSEADGRKLKEVPTPPLAPLPRPLPNLQPQGPLNWELSLSCPVFTQLECLGVELIDSGSSSGQKPQLVCKQSLAKNHIPANGLHGFQNGEIRILAAPSVLPPEGRWVWVWAWAWADKRTSKGNN